MTSLRERAEVSVLRLLNDNHEEVRAAAARALGRLRGPAAFEALVVAMSDGSSAVQSDVVQALGELGDPRALDALVVALGNTRIDAREDMSGFLELESALAMGRRDVVRACAAEALGQLGDVRAVEPLIAALDDEGPSIRRSASQALGRLGDVRAVEPLTALVNDRAESVRGEVSVALGELGDLEPGLGAIRDQADEVRERAVEALSRSDTERATEALVEALNDDWPEVSLRAAAALRQRGHTSATLGLIESLRSGDGPSRAWATVLLGELADPQAVEPLIEALENEEGHMREWAAAALGNFWDTRAVEPLIGVLGDDDPHAQAAAAKALGELGDGRAIAPLVSLFSAQDDLATRRPVVTALGKLHAAEAVEPFCAVIDEEPHFAEYIAQALGQIPEARDALLDRLCHKDPLVRLRAVEALGRLGDARDIKPLAKALKDKNDRVRQAAAEAQARLGEMGPLVKVLSDVNNPYRGFDLEILNELHDPALIEPMVLALRDPDPNMRAKAAHALGVAFVEH